jgi:hypothetical protein
MSANLYDQDFYAWTQQQAQLLKSGKFADVDLNHLIEEIESMGARERKELISRLEVLLTHLLKWQYQPERRGRSWQLSIIEEREKLLDHLQTNPSLKNPSVFADYLAKSYKYALIGAQRETGLSRSAFPAICPYTEEQIFDEDFYPEGQ